MNNLLMFCLSTSESHLNFIKGLDYQPVGLGEENFSNEWHRDNFGKNISEKNKFYGEYTFHYWLWKNYLNKINNNTWVGFCQYRKFWSTNNTNVAPKSLDELKPLILKKIPEIYEKYNVILGEEMPINNIKVMKFLKRGIKLFFKNPSILLNSKKRNIKFHFDMWHGSKYLDKAIELLNEDDKNDFKNFVNREISFNPHNMFICNSIDILKKYYSTVFPWLELCEKEFGFEKLKGYGETRIYGFLAERFMSYWFKKYTKYKTMPIVFYDIRKDFNHKPL